MILTQSQIELENSLRRILPTGVVSCWIPDGYDRVKDVIGGNHGTCFGAHPNVLVLPNLTDPSLGWFIGWDDYIDLTGLTYRGTSFSFSSWMYSTDDIVGHRYIFDAQLGRIIFNWKTSTDGKIALYDGSWKSFGDTPSSYVWHCITFALNGATGKAKLFLNSSEYGTERDYAPASIGGVVTIGSRYSKDLAHLDGYLTLPSLSKGVWSLQQHKNFYNATKGLFAPRG